MRQTTDEPAHGRDHVTTLALGAKESAKAYVQFCAEPDESRPFNEADFIKFFEFCSDEQVQDEVDKTCRFHATSFRHLEAFRHGDLPQLVWAKMPRIVACFDGRAMFKTYLSRSVRHLCLDKNRAEKRSPELLSLEARPEQPSPAASDEIAAVEQRHLLKRAAELTLDEREQKILSLLLAGVGTSEIARAFGKTPQTVRDWAKQIPLKIRQGLDKATEQAQQKVKSATAAATNAQTRERAADERP